MEYICIIPLDTLYAGLSKPFPVYYCCTTAVAAKLVHECTYIPYMKRKTDAVSYILVDFIQQHFFVQRSTYQEFIVI